MKTNEELLKENAELRSSVCALKICISDAAINVDSLTDSERFINTYSKTPVQNLADIKAGAVVDFTEHVKYNFEGIMSDDALIDFGNEYIANKLRGEAK